jgi:integrase
VSAAEALAFLATAKSDPLYPGLVLLLLYGMRRGEVLRLRWSDIEDNVIHVRQPVQRIKSELLTGPVKTRILGHANASPTNQLHARGRGGQARRDDQAQQVAWRQR